MKSSLSQTLANLVNPGFARVVNRFFVYGIIFPAFAGFASVSYKSCKVDTYEKIIKSKTYLMEKNVEQLHEILLFLVISLMVWAIIVAIILTISERKERLGLGHKDELAN